MTASRLAACLLIAQSLCATTYFVDATNGNNANAGTSSGAAWQTVSKVNATSFSADDVIQFKKGESWNEILAIPSSGTSGHPIIFTNYGSGALPLFNLASPTPRASCVTSSSKSYFTINGIQCANPTGPHINITTSAGVTIQNNTLLNTAANHGIAFNGVTTTATVTGNTIQDALGQPAGGTGITCTSGATCTGIVVTNNTVIRAGDVRKFGIIMYDADAAVIHDNRVLLNDIGIQLHTAHAAVSSASIYNNQVLDTKLYTSGDGEGMEMTGCAPATASVCPAPDAANTYTVSASIYDNYCSNINTTNANDCLGGVVLGTLLVYNNVWRGPAVYGAHISSGCTGSSFLNNSIYSISNTGILLDVNCTNNTLTNNIIHTATNHCMFAHATATGSTEDYNVCYNSGSTSGFTGGTHDLTSDPLFFSTPPRIPADFKLQLTSPAINSGTALGAPYQTAAFVASATTWPISTGDQGSSNWERGAFLFTTVTAAGGGTVTIYETDNAVQTGRPVTFGRAFKQGDFATCLQPIINGSTVPSYQIDVRNRWTDSSVKYAIVSLISPTFPSGGSIAVTFQSSGTCNNTGYLTQAQMLAFNSGGTGWGAQIVATAAAQTFTVNAATVLALTDPASNTFDDCKNNYMQQGPLVTRVLLRDCTTAHTYDFGWQFTTATPPVMTVNGATQYQSIYPSFEVSFYPGQNYNYTTNACSAGDTTCAAKIDFSIDNSWLSKMQDQVYDLTLKTGGTLATVFSRACSRVVTDAVTTNGSTTITSATGFATTDPGCPIYLPAAGPSGGPLATVIASRTNATQAVLIDAARVTGSGKTAYINDHYARTKIHKAFWSGTAPGNILINHDFDYLISAKAYAYYDRAQTVNPSPDFTAFMTGDRGDIGGGGVADGPNSTWGYPSNVRIYSANPEGRLIQREDLLYLYNMATCGTVTGSCAKAWYLLTGQSGARDAAMLSGQPYAITGGAGQWNWSPSFHAREDRPTGSFYCSGYDPNAIPGTSCGPTISPVGKGLSRHAHADQFTGPIRPVASVGTVTAGNWTIQDPSHWVDYAYTAYLLTGDYYFLDELYQEANYTINSCCAVGSSTGQSGASFFGYINPSPLQSRWYAWGLEATGYAAFTAPDSTAEAYYYTNMLNSNLEIQEGFMNVTGTALTPSSHNDLCTSYTYSTANRWDWGHCTVQSYCFKNDGTDCAVVIPEQLHSLSTGQCITSNGGYVGSGVGYVGGIFSYYIPLVLARLNELGFTQAQPIATEAYKGLAEITNNGALDSNGNPYLSAMYNYGTKAGAVYSSGCSGGIVSPPDTTSQYFPTWQAWRAALAASVQSQNDFDNLTGDNAPWNNYPCADHGYSLIQRANGTFIGQTNSTDQTCTGGTCSGATAQSWLFANVPYFANTPADGRSTGCGSSDAQIGFALAMRPAISTTGQSAILGGVSRVGGGAKVQ